MLLREQTDISSQRGMPMSRVDDSFSVTSVTGETVTFSYYNSGTLTTDAGQAAGTLVIGKLAYGPILDDMGTKIGNKGNSSLSFTCLALTNEVKLPFTILESGFNGTGTGLLQAVCAAFSNGDYAIDYRTGTVYAKKATTAATMTSVAYKRPASSGGSGGASGASSVTAQYISPSDFLATYTSASTITLSGMPFTITNSSQIVYVKVYNTSTKIATTYVAGSGNISFGYSAGVITIYSSGVAITTLTSNDTYEVGINGQMKTYDQTTDTEKVIEQSPLSAKYVADSILDTTNIAAATNYYPSSTGMSMDGYSAISITGKIIDADNTTTLTIEATNDEDTTSGDWIDVTKCFNDDNAGVATSIGASITVTSGTKTFAVSRSMFNYSYLRLKSVTGDATNTVIYKMRRMY